jgi:hypothetical protein
LTSCGRAGAASELVRFEPGATALEVMIAGGDKMINAFREAKLCPPQD